MVQRFDILARLDQFALRDRQLFVGNALIVVEPRDRRARFLLTPVEAVALLFGLASLARELLGLIGQTRLLVARVGHLRLAADDDFLLLVMLGIQRRNRGHRLRDGPFERGGFAV